MFEMSTSDSAAGTPEFTAPAEAKTSSENTVTNSILTDERSAAGSTPLSWKLISTTVHPPVNRLLEAV